MSCINPHCAELQPGQQFRKGHVEALCDRLQVAESPGFSAALDLPDERSINAETIRQLYLREAMLMPEVAKPLSETPEDQSGIGYGVPDAACIAAESLLTVP